MLNKSQLPLGRRADIFRLLALRLGLPTLEEEARRPGVMEAFRVSVEYPEGQHPDQVATVIKMQAVGPARLAVYYRRPDDSPLIYNFTVETERFQSFSSAFKKLNFDRLDDQPDLPSHGADLWLIERACGPFSHNIVLAPSVGEGVYKTLVELVKIQLHEALRTITV